MNKIKYYKTINYIVPIDGIPSEYRPIADTHMNTRQDSEVWVSANGAVVFYCSVALTNYALRTSCTYAPA